DTFGGGYVDLAVDLGVAPDRIDTIADPAAAQRHGTRTDGNMVGARAEVMAELAGLIESGRLDIPIASSYPLSQVRDAYRELEQRHTLGKIVLILSRPRRLRPGGGGSGTCDGVACLRPHGPGGRWLPGLPSGRRPCRAPPRLP